MAFEAFYLLDLSLKSLKSLSHCFYLPRHVRLLMVARSVGKAGLGALEHPIDDRELYPLENVAAPPFLKNNIGHGLDHCACDWVRSKSTAPYLSPLKASDTGEEQKRRCPYRIRKRFIRFYP
jgi:hypothetical protein